MTPTRGVPPASLRRAAAAVFGLVTIGLLIAGLVTLLTDDRGGSGTTAFPEGDGYPDIVSPLAGPLGVSAGWNGTAFINDNLWTSDNEQYAVWVGPDGSPFVGRRRLPDGAWTMAYLGDVAGNPLAAPTVADPHNVYAIAVDAEGYVHVAGNMHADPLRYVRSVRPGSIDEWTAATMVGAEESSVTYPAFIRAPDGALLFFYRDGGSGGGDTILNRRAPGSGTWERAATLIDGRSSGENAYIQRVAVDMGRSTIHLSYVWRADEDPASNRDVSYARSEDGGRTWLASDGSALTLPMTHDTADIVLATDPGSLRLVNQGGLAVDGDGYPHAVFRTSSSAGAEGVLHVWQEGRAWRHEPLLTDRSIGGRPAVAATDGAAYLVWTERDDAQRSTLWLTKLGAGPSNDEVALARLPVAGWEPTFDSVALAERKELHLLLPVTVGTDGGGTGAVATWDPALLGGALGGVIRRRTPLYSGRGARPLPSPAAHRGWQGRKPPRGLQPPRRRSSCDRRPTGGDSRRRTRVTARSRRSWS
jgi:hypothetical protein